MVYKITQYELVGKKLCVYEPMPFLEAKAEGSYTRFYFQGTNERYTYNSNLFELTTSIPHNAYSHTLTYLPYYAKVTEDIPSHYKLKGESYKHCQLMVEKHGNYLQFFHAPTKKVLRIALNSHIYIPE